MVAPRKFETKTREGRTSIVNNIVKGILSSMREQSGNDIREVGLKVYEVGHGKRPFGTHFPNDYIDFSIEVVGKTTIKELGSRDIYLIRNELANNPSLKKFDVETKDIFFGYGNFTPDIEAFPTIFRKFKNKAVKERWIEWNK